METGWVFVWKESFTTCSIQKSDDGGDSKQHGDVAENSLCFVSHI